MKQGSFVCCAWCGNILYRSQYSLRRSSTFFCNKVHEGKWRFAHGLKKKMASAYNPNALPIYKPNLKPSSELAYIIGVLVGDGSVGKRAIRLSVTKQAFADSFAIAMGKIGLPAKVIMNTRYDKPEPLTTFNIQLKSALFARWYRDLDISFVKRFPADFSRGFYESEGSYRETHGISICNSDKAKLVLVTECLKLLGLKPTPIKQYLAPSIKTKNKKPMLRTCLRVDDSRKFLEIAKPCIKEVMPNGLLHNSCVSP